MSDSYIESFALPQAPLWEKSKDKRALISFDLEITARCNNNCRHCYINVARNDKKAITRELSISEISRIADEAIDLGALWCLITGGEPLLRKDFFDIYLLLKKKGLLVSVFTNAGLLTQKHIDFFEIYPPRDIEITVYGVTKKTYEKVTRVPGSFAAFMRGVDLLLKNNIKVRFKAMALRSNAYELADIALFCRERTKDFFRFDPFLHLRFDRSVKRNREIKSERLSPEEIVALERADPERSSSLKKNCDKLIRPEFAQYACGHLFHCGAGNGSFVVSYDGLFRLCSSLWHPDCVYDLKKGNLKDAWDTFVPVVRGMSSQREKFLNKCRKCPIINLCIWCPANAHLETGTLDEPVEYFCNVAHSRKQWLD